MKIRSYAELATADERTQMFAPLGLLTDRLVVPEAAAEFQQRAIETANLVDAVPSSTQSSFEKLRLFHAYGVLCYELFGITDDLTWVVLEQALRERFIEFYQAQVPIINANGLADVFATNDFSAIGKAFRRRGSHSKWKLRLDPSTAVQMPLTLAPLLSWARRVRLLDGQRNRRVQLAVYPELRNHFAHGGGLHVGMPNHSARAIHDLAEVINRLWGVRTAGGRIYPSPLTRRPIVIGWSPDWGTGAVGSEVTEFIVERLGEQSQVGWTYIIVLAAEQEDQLVEFDARRELTTYPAQLLWGPGGLEDAVRWAEQRTIAGDQIEYLDRLFAIRVDQGRAFFPCRPEVLLSLPTDQRPGRWTLARADFPADALGHVRHQQRGEPCPDPDFGGCAVEVICEGAWAEVVQAAITLSPDVQPATYSEAHVPPRWSPPADVGY